MSVDITEQEKANLLKEEFITNINHDIKTPLFGISALITILKSQENNDKKKQWMQGILDCVEGLNNYVSKILDVISSEALLSNLEKSTFNIKEQFHKLHQIVKPALTHKNLILKVDCEDKDIFSYEWAFQQIFLNLISNAIKFTETGEIKIKAQVHRHIFKGEVADTGCGIAKKNQKIIFEKFKKITPGYLSSGYTGSGLGLSIACNFVEKLKGKIKLKSALKKGAVFSVQFPL